MALSTWLDASENRLAGHVIRTCIYLDIGGWRVNPGSGAKSNPHLSIEMWGTRAFPLR